MSYYDKERDRDSYKGRDRDKPNPCRLYVGMFVFLFCKNCLFFLIKSLGNVNRYVREKDIRDLFSRYGRIRDLILRVSCNYE
jgi:hypothetical protein